MKRLRVASVQFEHRAGDKRSNLATIERLARKAVEQGARLVCFPECCITGYWFLRRLSREALLDLAEPVFEGPSSQRLATLARELGVTLGAGLIERTEEDELYNSYVVALPDGRRYRHRKLHAFVNEHVRSGSEFTVFRLPEGWQVGVLICYDNNIVENVRITALLGAEILLAPHQTGGCASINPHTMGAVDRRLWEKRRRDPGPIEEEFRGPKGRGWLMRWLPSRAHDNGMFLVFSNGVGVDDDEIRTGNAMVLDPYGRILAETCRADEQVVIADLEGDLLEECTGRRWIRTRRPELYDLLTRPTGTEVDTRTLRFDNKGV